ncbi:DUF937 domain-containing protein [Microvirga puerhi]|uniref:DUF937 domain-containing protein n=1 Tax=Microvirga puerhi TaxID=2876078 RepID=A0ABS7VIP2_9HYPH|nr:DUF937 domain-containing protein [Microvirga puerhi]MBZ6075386.1 DUF937 domain-containing protein [Microvirga puerhi]
MAINLVSLIAQFLTPDVIAKIASALGADRSQIGRAVTAAVPGLLASLAGTASTPEGSRKLFDAVSQQSPGILDNLGGMIGGPRQENLADNGTNVLSSLLGGSSTSALGNAVTKYAGLGSGMGSSLLGLLTPVVMAALNKQSTASGLDASGLSQLLTSQKSEIMKALPPGFSDLLSGTGLLSGLGATATGAAQTAREAIRPAASSAERVVRQSSSPNWAWAWAIPVIVLLGLGWWYFGRTPPSVNQQAGTTTTQTAKNAPDQLTTGAVQSAQNLTVGSVDLGSTVQSTVTNLQQTLQGVTNVDTAKAALPKLTDAATQLDKVDNLVGQLPAGGKTALASLVTSARPPLEETFGRVLAIPGVADIAKPTIDTIRGKLDVLTKTAG